MTSKWWILLAAIPLLRLLKTRRGPSRETIVLPKDERVVLLGASSGVGRDLAHIYAKRGARICLVARRQDSLNKVKQECLAFGLDQSRILLVAADVTKTDDLIRIRSTVESKWGGLDTLHILAGVPSTRTLMELGGVSMAKKTTATDSLARFDFVPEEKSSSVFPSVEGLNRVAAEARNCAEINYLGTVLALSCFLPLLASSSKSPAVHHLSSVAATIPAPSRAIYSATKAAAYMAFESCRVECEGSGVRFLSILPGTIANDFRLKTAAGSQTGGRDETKLPIRHALESWLLQPEAVIRSILDSLAVSPHPYPLIPYPPFSWISKLRLPPSSSVYLPFNYRLAKFLQESPLAGLVVEPSARRKYGLPNA